MPLLWISFYLLRRAGVHGHTLSLVFKLGRASLLNWYRLFWAIRDEHLRVCQTRLTCRTVQRVWNAENSARVIGRVRLSKLQHMDPGMGNFVPHEQTQEALAPLWQDRLVRWGIAMQGRTNRFESLSWDAVAVPPAPEICLVTGVQSDLSDPISKFPGFHPHYSATPHLAAPQLCRSAQLRGGYASSGPLRRREFGIYLLSLETTWEKLPCHLLRQ